ncbi:MAG: tRNA (N(6)-L-threonylcarbamoyladenosine(37)-C(2))-methylthiotransferase MtaB [Acidobacteria bacterium]|nr:tRNA (N(6)-L-threonylcarbamoyladenosine(37)-C(2))-methylthiotransferase MtaB [Acidobacteriota bacterium]MBI3661904.1 tRNA (N(6)-L-threonylcarbamoyladenosine(37)-C(2))-methylthiotransferase MtaB [Acidobacteriota bacterium]
MATFHIEQFGCRATQADAAAIERQLVERGFAPAAGAAGADVVVINTCTVTANADSQARQAIRHFHAENPQARIIVTGCYAQRAPEELAQIQGVAWVVGNSHKTEIAALVGQAFRPVQDTCCAGLQAGMSDFVSLASAPAKILTGDIFAQTEVLVAPIFGGESDPSASLGAGHTRPILKIQDGCNNRCSYCVIPFVRGRSRSLTPARVIEEIRKLTSAGYQEIVLSGINLGSYGRDLAPRVELIDLARRILDETPLERLRLSSIEPQDVTQDLVDLVALSGRVARHFHIPLQSASDRVLAAMHRWYRAAHYARKIELIREIIPAAAVGADVIAGFPGETDADHRATMEFVERLPLSYLHVFSFSKRPGTAAEKLCSAGRNLSRAKPREAGTSLEVSPQVIKQRSRELRALAEAKKAAFRAAQSGSTLRVLTLREQGEDSSGPWTAALSDNYLQLRVAGHLSRNQFLEVSLAANGEGLFGELSTEAKIENRN